jgi:DNA processing protein
MDKYPIQKLEGAELYKLFPDLRHAHHPPTSLYYRGKSPRDDSPRVTIIGSRRPSDYGREVTRRLMTEIAGTNITIVSGLAYGIDSLAHEEALRHGLGCIAFPGSGLDADKLYPQAHLSLAENILESGGSLFSEYEPDATARPYFFPERNRLMAAVSDLILIIEGYEQSGTLITARLALDMGKDVAVVPGNITSPLSYVPNQLLHEGAHPVLRGEDIISLVKAKHRDSKSASIVKEISEIDRLISRLDLQ